MAGNQHIVLPEQGRQMREHTPQLQPPATATRRQIPQSSPRLMTPGTNQLCELEKLGFATAQRHRRPVPTLEESSAPGNTYDLDEDQHLHSDEPGGDCRPDVHLRMEHPDGFPGTERTSVLDTEKAMVVAFVLRSRS